MSYELLRDYRAGNLSRRWREKGAKLLLSDPHLSPLRAGEIAAAILATDAANEMYNLEEDESTDSDTLALVEWLLEHYQINSDLVTLSGTRTLIADMHIYPLSID